MGIFKPQTYEVELYQGGWQQRLADALEAVERAERVTKVPGPPQTLDEAGDSDAYLAAVDAYNALRNQAISEGVVRVTVQRMDPEAWEDLVAAHPPRTDPEVPEATRKSDAAVGVNERTFCRPLVLASVVKIEPEMTVEELLAGVSSKQLGDIYDAAFLANRGRGFDPKAAPALTPSPSSSGTAT